MKWGEDIVKLRISKDVGHYVVIFTRFDNSC